MYRIAAQEINKGLSLLPRLILGAFALLFGVVMALVAPPNDKAAYFYAFAIFCLLISVACVTTGRTRQFVGSIIGITLFLLTCGYTIHELLTGAPLVGPRSQPNVANSFLCLVFFGLPGIAYAAKARFGFNLLPHSDSGA
jgi:hypothetical protein